MWGVACFTPLEKQMTMEQTQTYIPAITPVSNGSAITEWPRVGARRAALLVLVALLVGAFLLGIATGSVNIPLGDVIKVLTGAEPAKATWATIIQDFRLPKALAAVLSGAALAVSGLQMQTLFRNPLAGPYVLGVSSGASLGVAVVILALGTTGSVMLAGVGLLGDFGMAVAACLGSALVMGIVLLAARRVESSVTLLILGLMFGYAVSSVVSLLLHFSLAERVQAYVNWTFGSFGGVTWNQMGIFAPVVLAGLALAYLLAKPLNALLLGDAYAASLGLNVRRARVWIVMSTALLAGVVTAFCGPIGFLGIAVPHLSRGLLNTSDHRVLIPAAGLMGAAIALIVDLIAHVPGSQIVLPLNAVMALIGAPVVIWVILRQRSVRASFAS
jgi:iron complex transport system permease protein